MRHYPHLRFKRRADLDPCTCPDDDDGPWDPEWDGTFPPADPACPYHGVAHA